MIKKCENISSLPTAPDAAGPETAPRAIDDEAFCQACTNILQACEICKKPEAPRKNDKTVVISSQNDEPGAISIAGGSFWTVPAGCNLLADGAKGNIAASTPGPAPGSSTGTARAGGLLSRKILASVLTTQPKRTSTKTRSGRGTAPRKEETWLVQLIKRVTSSCHLALDDSGEA